MHPTSFNPPASWDGSCTTENSIPENALCPEGYCAQSLDIDKLDVIETGCTPSSALNPQYTPPYFLTEARACSRNSYDGCADKGNACAPVPPPGFRHCLHRTKPDDHACPDDYPYKEIYSRGYDDNQDCEDCTCGPPVGSMCSGCIATYADATCSVMRACYDVSSAGLTCVGIQPPGAALLSKQALNITYTPGTCEPGGGGAIGSVDLRDPVIFCCQEPLK
jgi:hypothetical protein